MAKRFMHIGVPTTTSREGEVYAEGMKVHILAPPNEHSVEWLRFEPGSNLPIEIQTRNHIAFDVDDIQAEVQGKNVIVPVTDIGSAYIAFILDGELPVEYYQSK